MEAQEIVSLLILFGMLFVMLAIRYIIAKKFETIAFHKGYDRSVHSFALCFWLGAVGWIYVLALPNIYTFFQNEYIIKLLEEVKNKELNP